MSTVLKDFQSSMRDALCTRFLTVKQRYDALSSAPAATREAALHEVRQQYGAVMLQAPTGVGKTLIAVDTVQAFAAFDTVVWFWLVPFAGLMGQAQRTFQAEAPAVKLLSLESDRFSESLRPGGLYTLSWQSVASTQSRRLFREDRDDGLSIDELILQARQLGYRIGCVVDEAHHGLHNAREASTFFSQVLRPDYALMMTATPRDEDAVRFSQRTGYRLGPTEEWASITRDQGVTAGLLKPEVKTVRFIARAGNEARLLDFERVALAQAVVVHRRIKAELERLQVGFTPLLLVQVPNGATAAEQVRQMMVSELGFAPDSVRVHTADEPDEHLAAIANDNQVEVLVFKMAVAMGFDAPRAFTLAALRGVRDASFGVQVVGRIMRVHRLLQGRAEIPDLLKNGYVFLANQEDQEGLRSAAELINTLQAQEPLLGQQTVLTLHVDEQGVDVSLADTSGLFSEEHIPDTDEGRAEGVADADDGTGGSANASAIVSTNASATGSANESRGDRAAEQASAGTASPASGSSAETGLPERQGTAPAGLPTEAAAAPSLLSQARNILQALRQANQLNLLEPTDTQGAPGNTSGAAPPTVQASVDAAIQATASRARTYPRRPEAPERLRTERLPPLPDNFEEQIVSLVDFTRVLADRDRVRAQLTQRTEGLFEEDAPPLDEHILAQLSAAVIAHKAKQAALPFDDIDERDFLARLEERFREALRRQGIDVPSDDETLRRQLDLVLVRNPRLIREAHKRVRAGLIEVAEVSLPGTLVAPRHLVRSAKNIYGVFPHGLNRDERDLANILDTDPEVVWWHRNPASEPGSVALWAWSGGVHAFFPDFVVAVEGRTHADGQALVEVKGEHLQEWEKAKAGAGARHHGRVFMVGKRGRDGGFYFMRLDNGQLQLDGVYETQRLRVNT